MVEVKPNFKDQSVEIFYTGQLNRNSLNNKIEKFGYKIVDGKLLIENHESLQKRLFEAGAIGVIFLLIYLIAKETNLLPSFDFTGNLNYLTIFAIGLVASTSTCMATSGALYLSIIPRRHLKRSEGSSDRRERNARLDFSSDLRQTRNDMGTALFFNTGRIISYGFFGLIAGFIGQALITNSGFGPFLTFLAAVFMILLGLDMAKIISIGKIIPSSLNKSIFLRLEDKIKTYPNKAPFFLGAITYLLPCGFTQAVQVYALGQGSPIQSAITMVVFALGTVPALLLIGSMSSLTSNKFYPYFLKVMGVLVFIVGFIYFSNFTSLYGININPFASNITGNGNSATVKNGVQTIEMRVVTSGYLPNYFTVKKDIPVKWVINGENVFGCQAYLVVPKLSIQKTIVAGLQTIDFTPTETGFINFSCGMGMYRGRIEVVN
ncbi:MAG: hypothetical protein UR68_C0038G0002 [Candidatus Roizmanbacteria bacterium GW2011_GWA2_35_19]|uniref:Urease accessory protein UreH-like transmembrane domain-containing protein n=1 Tax=Candidatus Roizmanbacteria bacterium GW2011_GWA2_35_19 TaxID=1618478 RepID=A0A0G0E644_9BACT|nr:MAG: hypothetical protein UR68_C0038G0002 [Candidatus Roizmanbacteria bacterium GW2011_GWA2_35_19]